MNRVLVIEKLLSDINKNTKNNHIPNINTLNM